MSHVVGAYDGRFGRLYSVTSSRGLVAHAHGEWQLIFNLRGPPAGFRTEAAPMPIREGEALVLPPWTIHSKAPGTRGPSWMVSLLLDRSWLGAVQASGLVPAAMPDAAWRGPLCRQSQARLRMLCRLALIHRGSPPQEVEHAVAGLLQSVASAAMRDRGPLASAPLRHLDHRIRKALRIIQSDEGRRIALGDLAKSVGLSRAHFFKLFKQGVGTSPLRAINSARIAHAVLALNDPDNPIAQLADELGFSTQGHFTRFFVRHLFIPPGEYRDRLRIESARHDDIIARVP